MLVFPPCMDCEHFDEKEKTFNKCKAFPDYPGIPWVIVSGENDHNKPLPEQKNEIVFERKGA